VTPSEDIFSQPFCSLRWNAVAGTTYRIAVGGQDVDDEGSFELDLHAFSPPPNDAFAQAQTLPSAVPVVVDGTTVDASPEPGEPVHAGFNEADSSVWFTWTADATRAVRIETCADEFEYQRIAVYTGDELTGLTEVSPDYVDCPVGGTYVVMLVAAGTTYRIAVDSDREEEGPFTLTIRDPAVVPPGNPPGPPPAGDKPPAFNLKKALKKCKKIKRKKARKACIRKAKKRARAR
jgi:hypothetical protein